VAGKEEGGGAAGGKGGDPAGGQEETHPLGLGKRQRFLLKGQWKGVSRELQTTGVTMFVQMFTSSPEVLSLFTKFQNLATEEEMRASEAFQEHGEKVMERIDEAVASVETMDIMTSILLETGAYHKKVPGFKPEMFKMAEAPFLASVEATLGERYTPQMDTIYHVIAAYIVQTLIEGYNR